jgi:hypothetical protein
MIRDNALAASGLLNKDVGGKSVSHISRKDFGRSTIATM